MKPEDAMTFSTAPDLSEPSLEDAVVAVVPPVICTLSVHPRSFACAKRLIKRIGADTQDNPLSPQINVVVDDTFTDEYEWSLSCGSKVIWSPGA